MAMAKAKITVTYDGNGVGELDFNGEKTTFDYDAKTGDPYSIVYEGDVNRERKPHGRGKMTFPDGSSYEGDFVNVMPHGKGKMTYADGSSYEGDFDDNGMPKGIGKLTRSDGTIYEGEGDFAHANGKPEGRGKLTFSDGSIYKGDFSNGKPHGEGKMIYPNGSTYEGGWWGGRRDGKGSYTGVWKEGVPSGRGVYRWCYEAWKSGQFIKNLTYAFLVAEAGASPLPTPKSDIDEVFLELKRQSALNDEMIDAIAEKDKALSEKDEIIAMKDEEISSLKSALRKEKEIAETERDEEIVLLEARLKRMGQISGEEEEENPQAKRQRTESGRSRNATNNRASRSRARMVQVKQENIRAGSIKCPDPQCNNIILHNGGCKLLTCTNHQPHYLYFCAHCKKVGEEGSEIIRCDCPNRNTQADRDLAQEMRNQRSRENPEVVE